MNPEVTAAPGFYRVTWRPSDYVIHFSADRLKRHGDATKAMVRIAVVYPSGDEEVRAHEQLNLSSGQSRRGLSKRMAERVKCADLDWDVLVEESCRQVLEREEQGAPTRRLQPVANVSVKSRLRSTVFDGLPVLTYAPGGSLKSYIALYKALCLENGLAFLGEETTQANTLYLDWEVSESEASRRCTKFMHGLQNLVYTELKYPHYRRCTGPLSDEASEIAKVIAEHNIGYVVIDSAGLACGGDVASSELTIAFFNTLRKVTASTEAASEILTHVTKTERREESQQRLPIGSIYWENLSRATWEVRSTEGPTNVYCVGLFPRKCNLGRLEPVGLRLTFAGNAITVEEATVSDIATEAGVLRDFILAELDGASANITQLVEATGAPASTVRWHLMKLKDAGLVESISRGVYRRLEAI